MFFAFEKKNRTAVNEVPNELIELEGLLNYEATRVNGDR